MKRLSIAALFVFVAFAGQAQINKGESFISGSISGTSANTTIFSEGFNGTFQLSGGYNYAIKDNRLLGLSASFGAIEGQRNIYSITPSYRILFPINDKLFWQIGAFGSLLFQSGGESNINQFSVGISLPGLGYRLHDRIILNLSAGSLSYGFDYQILNLSWGTSSLSLGALLRLGKKAE